jgi:hypothetical protein
MVTPKKAEAENNVRSGEKVLDQDGYSGCHRFAVRLVHAPIGQSDRSAAHLFLPVIVFGVLTYWQPSTRSRLQDQAALLANIAWAAVCR